MLKKLNNSFCINEKRIYASGESNGGMFTYYLSQQIPEVFNGFGPIFGEPAMGDAGTSLKAAESYYISVHGRQDDTLPPNGGADGNDQFIYESERTTHMIWGMAQGCDMTSWSKVETPYDGKPES
jgi:poly(3-hydroxybutyrate) depolymerase